MERNEGGNGDASATPDAGSGDADRDYGFSGRGGAEEGNYSSAYGRGSAGARDNPSASGVAGAGYERGGTEIPAPDEPANDEPAGDGAADGR